VRPVLQECFHVAGIECAGPGKFQFLLTGWGATPRHRQSHCWFNVHIVCRLSARAYDRRLGRPSPKRVPVQTVERVLELYRERYFDLNVWHFCEKLSEKQGVGLSYTRVKMALQGAVTLNRRKELFRFADSSASAGLPTPLCKALRPQRWPRRSGPIPPLSRCKAPAWGECR